MEGKLTFGLNMRFVSFITSLIFAIFILSWIYLNYPEARSVFSDISARKKFNTLEVNYSAESIMDIHKKELLKDSNHNF